MTGSGCMIAVMLLTWPGHCGRVAARAAAGTGSAARLGAVVHPLVRRAVAAVAAPALVADRDQVPRVQGLDVPRHLAHPRVHQPPRARQAQAPAAPRAPGVRAYSPFCPARDVTLP
jgi:hypothetical protein